MIKLKTLLTEAAKLNASKIVRMLKNRSDWGDMGDQVRVKRGNLEVVDTFYYGGDKALKHLRISYHNGY